jgi:very-short-patch-repair endonuclease
VEEERADLPDPGTIRGMDDQVISFPDFDPRTPFRRRTALAAGVTPKQLRGPAYRVVLPGAYVAASTVVTPLVRARAALLPYGGVAWASHASAARAYDLPIPTIANEHVSVARPGLRRRHRGVKVHVGAPVARTRLVRGVPVSEPRMLFVEMAGLVSLVDLVVLGDAMVRRGLVTPEALVAFCASVPHPAAAASRDAASYVRRDVDSPMETRLRMLIVLAGLPEPQVNLKVRDDGEVIRKYDLSYPAVRVAIEYNGKVHVLTPGAWEADLERRHAIDDDGWRLVPVISSGIFSTPEQTLRRIHRVLLARRLPGVPTRLGDEWRAHFPGHADAA